MIPAIVPVKALSRAKSRLAAELGEQTAARLATAMLRDLLAALKSARGIGPVAVVTPDAEVAGVAETAGALALLRPDPGLNAAIESASAELAATPDAGVLVLLGDVAGARAEDLEALLARAPDPGVGLAPSADGGTSALLRRPHDAIPAGFGPGSAKIHRDLAARAGVRFAEVALPSLALDVDDRADLDALERTGAAGVHMRAELRALARTAR